MNWAYRQVFKVALTSVALESENLPLPVRSIPLPAKGREVTETQTRTCSSALPRVLGCGVGRAREGEQRTTARQTSWNLYTNAAGKSATEKRSQWFRQAAACLQTAGSNLDRQGRSQSS